ncbi:mannitol dehydrogenase family protein [Saprospiraceae bacterium]|jgi:mannitol 2-dehydrogenase|nr:mannitol dehydrogenase family protein [Saprospiraceae bacterium]MDB4768868.1 mannitol dehydrogenase family protein [Saprospiraceae bacterium]MDC3253539.1 mannitol dehydrogenase family protein [bacterium]|tara:strand:+ start:1803 stop:3287 length:1485 start_codon:yes stop_codon:yes gene_type:complete
METSIQLNQGNLQEVGSHMPVPNYNRESNKTGIVHIGVGGFHRAHQAYYLHQLRQLGEDSDWGICGIGLREADAKLHDIFKQQDHLYTLIVKHPDGKIEPEVIGSIVDFKMGITDPEPVIAHMAHADTKIVSLTITEGGYNFNPTTGEFNFNNPDIQHELRHSNDPITVYGFLTAALKRRRDNGLPAFTILSCDNIEHNGDMTRKMLLSFAEMQDADLAEWIGQEVCFPNSMVDRITPVTTNTDIETLVQNYGVTDAWPVTCEPFIQWVVEDKFSNGRPAFEKVGVQFVPDVGPYEKMKLRLLNAGHSVLGLLGALHGHPTINACIEDQTFKTYLRAFLDQEATPILGTIEGIDLEDYKDSLLERFANPNIKDSVSRICSESSAKLPKFLISTIHDNLATGGSIKFATLVIAAWCYYSDKGMDRHGHPIEIIDAMGTEIHQAAKQTTTDPIAFIRQESLFGDLIKNERFIKMYTEAVQKIYQDTNIKKYMKDMI